MNNLKIECPWHSYIIMLNKTGRVGVMMHQPISTVYHKGSNLAILKWKIKYFNYDKNKEVVWYKEPFRLYYRLYFCWGYSSVISFLHISRLILHSPIDIFATINYINKHALPRLCKLHHQYGSSMGGRDSLLEMVLSTWEHIFSDSGASHPQGRIFKQPRRTPVQRKVLA